MNAIVQLCEKARITDSLGILDYEYMVRKSNIIYGGASVEEIIRFATVGTEIALGILEARNDNDELIPYEISLYQRLEKMLVERLGENYPWIRQARHFVSNPLNLNDYRWMKYGYF